jgi:hypothetical protein
MSGDNPDKGKEAKDEKVRVAIIGAGIAGLTAAWELRARGFEVQVYEQNSNLGGKLGANPMRLPVKALVNAEFSDDAPTPPAESRKRTPEEEALLRRLKKDSSLSSKDLETLEQQLASKGASVPSWINAIIRRWIDVRQSRMSRGREQHRDEDEEENRQPVDTPTFTVIDPLPQDGPPMTWRIARDHVDASTGRAIRHVFSVSIHERFNKTWVMDINDDLPHEHCYHMYLNWYVNFWRVMKEIGLDKSTHFEPRDHYLHMSPGSAPIKRRTHTLKKLGKAEQWAENMLAGITTLPDSFLVLYSALDLVSEPLDPSRYLDRISVHGFLSSRWYASEESLKIHEHLLLRAFAVPAYYSSAYAYQKHLAFTLAAPDPALWVLKSNVDSTIFGRMAGKLEVDDAASGGTCRIHCGKRVTRLGLDRDTGRVTELIFRPSDTRWPRSRNDGERNDDTAGPEQRATFRPDHVILAVPPLAAASIVSDLRDRLPGMAAVRKLQSGVTAVLDLHFKRKIEDVPSDHVVLRNSRYAISFFDNSQLWKDELDASAGEGGAEGERPTHLSVAVTDFYKIEGMSKDDAAREILADLRRFIPFQVEDDVDFSRTYLQMNVNEPLFLNEVGSEPWRPETITEIPNLFLAGDFVANDIDVICVEGAVLSGLDAARAVQAQLRRDRPALSPSAPFFDEIKILMPKTLPRANAEAMKALLAPYLPAAKAASSALEMRRHPERALSPRELGVAVNGMLSIPGNAAANAIGLQAGAAQWLADLPIRRP